MYTFGVDSTSLKLRIQRIPTVNQNMSDTIWSNGVISIDSVALAITFALVLLVGIFIGFGAQYFIHVYLALITGKDVANAISRGDTKGHINCDETTTRNKTASAQGLYTNVENGTTVSDVLDRAPLKVPRHIAVIMDGNRRFGRLTHSDPLQGHWAGGQRLVDFVQWCMDDGVEMLTVYAFSTENWNREAVEVSTLMSIFAQYAKKFRDEALARNVKVNVLSTDFDRLPANVQEAVRDLQESTAHCNSNTSDSNNSGSSINSNNISYSKSDVSRNSSSDNVSDLHGSVSGVNSRNKKNTVDNTHRTRNVDSTPREKKGFTVNICLSYGSRGDITNACRDIAKQVTAGTLHADAINEDTVTQHLSTHSYPDPDILIRTSGEYRLSNFMLWQLAYTEMFFVDQFWPQLTHKDFRRILHQYATRNRRFGV